MRSFFSFCCVGVGVGFGVSVGAGVGAGVDCGVWMAVGKVCFCRSFSRFSCLDMHANVP